MYAFQPHINWTKLKIDIIHRKNSYGIKYTLDSVLTKSQYSSDCANIFTKTYYIFSR